jgi:hypothetical protein
MVHRDSSHTHVHLAVLCICDAHTLYALGQGTVTVQKYVTIYGNCRVLCVRYALCLCAALYYTCSVVASVRVGSQEMTSSCVMTDQRLCDVGAGASRSSGI